MTDSTETGRRRRKSIVDQVQDYCLETLNDKTRVEFLDTGSTVLNHALSGDAKNGGWGRGRICNIVGDGATGKTILTLEAAAHAFYGIKKKKSKLFPDVKNVSIVYNNVEGVMDFPLETMYKEKFVSGIEWVQIATCEDCGRDFQRRVKNLKKGEFLLYIIDSLDALTSNVSKARIEKSIKEDKDEDGAYKTEKASYFSKSFFNHLCEMMIGKDATLLIVSQTRQNIGVTFGEKYYRTGGKAMDFYTHQVCWLRIKKKIDKTYLGENRINGIDVEAKIKRNKLYSPYRTADFSILFKHGVDNNGDLANWYIAKTNCEIEELVGMKRRDLINTFETDFVLRDKVVIAYQEYQNKIDENTKEQRRSKF